MSPTLVLLLQLSLVAFALAGAVQLVRRRLGRTPPTRAPMHPISVWIRVRELGRWLGWAGLLVVVAGMLTRAPAGLVVAGMGAAAAGAVIFILARIIDAFGRRGG